MGTIYLLRAEATDRYKIGFTESEDVAQRIAALQTGCPFPIALVAQREGDKAFEKALHYELIRFRKFREWFEFKDHATAVYHFHSKQVPTKIAPPKQPVSVLQKATDKLFGEVMAIPSGLSKYAAKAKYLKRRDTEFYLFLEGVAREALETNRRPDPVLIFSILTAPHDVFLRLQERQGTYGVFIDPPIPEKHRKPLESRACNN